MGQADFVLSDSADGTEFFVPCAVLGKEGLWAVWQGYRQKGERVSARFCDRKGLSPTEAITPEPGRCHAPFVGLVREPAAVWIDGSDGEHRVLSSARRSSAC